MCLIFGSIEPLVILRCVSEALVLLRYSWQAVSLHSRDYLRCKLNVPMRQPLLEAPSGLWWQLDAASQSLHREVFFFSILYQRSSNHSLPQELHMLASLTVPGLGCHGGGNHQGAIEDCCLALWVREPGDTQWDRNLPECLLSQVFEGEGDVETGEKKCQGPKLVQVTVCLGKATERQ